MLRQSGTILSLLLSLLFNQSSTAVAQSAVRPGTLVNESVDNGKLVTLSNNTYPAATTSNDRGAVASDLPLQNLWLQLKRSPEQQAAFDEYVRQLADPSSPNFRKWLSAEQVGQQFGLTQEDIGTISNWLESEALTVNGVAANRMLISFSGTAGQIDAAFHTSIHHLSVNGVPHVANMSDPKIPAALAAAVAGVVKLNDFLPASSHTKANLRRQAAANSLGPDYTLGPNQFVSPQDLATIYNFGPLFKAGKTGKGQMIVVLEDSDMYSASDWTQFRKQYGLTRPYIYGNLSQVHPTSAAAPCEDPGANFDSLEATLDAQWSSAAAPDANIVLAACANTYNFGGFIAALNLVNSAVPPPVLSLSYSQSEAEQGEAGNLFIKNLFEQAAAEGVSVFVATGDSGADDRDRQSNVATSGISVNALGSSPYNVAVGGTDYEDTYLGEVDKYWSQANSPFGRSALSYIPEIPWNKSCASVLSANYFGFPAAYGANGFCNSAEAVSKQYLNIIAGGGGPSIIYDKPSWQNVHGNPSDGVRDLPDISLFAAAGPWGHAYVVCYSAVGFSCVKGYFYDAGGTSFSTPIMAGIQALINQKVGGRTGNPNPTYYALAQREYGDGGNSSCNASLGKEVDTKCIFYDVTAGDIDIYCQGNVNCYTDGITKGVLSLSSSKYEPAYTAESGWDFATGIGTVNAYNLVMNWPGASMSKSH